MDLAILLVHGYLGSPADLEPLASALGAQFGAGAVECVRLPGHGPGLTPPFDEAACLAVVADSLDRHLALGRTLVLIGHSTGGSLILAELVRRLAADPAGLDALKLLVLCATPPRVDLGYARRWDSHAGTGDLADIGALVGLVNRLVRRGPLTLRAPVLIVQGEADELVPLADADLWASGRLDAPLRRVTVPGARHHLFTGPGADLAIDSIVRAVNDLALPRRDPAALLSLEPGLAGAAAAWPDTLAQVAAGPAGARALGEPYAYTPVAAAEPTLANIEITTRCNLGCPACARTQLKKPSRLMSLADFRRILGQLPHAWRIVLVGLGEPLLHPEVVEFVRTAATAGRRVSLVSNAMALDAALARALCDAGLAGITFSLDAVDQAGADRVRPGSDMGVIQNNIRGFMDLRAGLPRLVGAAAFTALGADNLDGFGAVVDFAADLGLDALMVSDLNFATNQPRSLHRTLTPDQTAGLRRTLRHAASRRLPVLSVRGLEEIGLPARVLDYLVLRGERIAERSPGHRHCASPWQTIPVGVDGRLTLCDCQPEIAVGNIHRDPVSAWWNGPALVEQRQRMLGDNPPEACLVCPRF